MNTNTDDKRANEVITLALIVGYCYSALNSISDMLSNPNDAPKANAKVYEAIKFIKDKTATYQTSIDLPKEGTE